VIRGIERAELQFFRREHYVVMPAALAAALDEIRGWVDELVGWPESPGHWMRWYETTPSGTRTLCRLENFVPYHPELGQLATGAATYRLMHALMGEAAYLFKEKVNLKLPGGAGYLAHQDAPAFTTFGQRYHITMCVALDDQRPDNGGLEVSDPVAIYETLPQAPDGTIDPALEARMPWRPLMLEPGDVVLFDSYLPHRSGPNTSERSRRAIYLTYNRRREGDRYDDYFAHKRSVFPPECERVPGVDYSAAAATYNLGNPIE
jgi:hypothetical protein